jgi:hypothetical protein
VASLLLRWSSLFRPLVAALVAGGANAMGGAIFYRSVVLLLVLALL